MRNVFGLVAHRPGDPEETRCQHPAGKCRNVAQTDDRLCNFHHARAAHEQHRGRPDPGCGYCPAKPGEPSRLNVARLADLADLEPGWYDGDGDPPTAAALHAAAGVLARAPFELAPDLWVGPDTDGSLTIETSSSGPDWVCADADSEGVLWLFAPLTPQDETDPGNGDGVRFDGPDQLWEYVANVQAGVDP